MQQAAQPEQKSSIVAVYESVEMAKAAVKSLQHDGIDMTLLSVIGKDSHLDQSLVGYYNTGDLMKARGRYGAFWGGLWGMLFGTAVFLLAGAGPILVGGPLVASMVNALDGAAVIKSIDILDAALVDMGMPTNSAFQYEADIQAGRFILIAQDASEQAGRTKALIERTQHLGIKAHAA